MPAYWRFIATMYVTWALYGAIFVISAPEVGRRDVCISFGLALVLLTVGLMVAGKKWSAGLAEVADFDPGDLFSKARPRFLR